MRREIIRRLGGKCAKCGLTDERVLQVNHINGGGSREQRLTYGSNYAIYREIAQGYRLYDINLLCANCNIIYEFECGRRKL